MLFTPVEFSYGPFSRYKKSACANATNAFSEIKQNEGLFIVKNPDQMRCSVCKRYLHSCGIFRGSKQNLVSIYRESRVYNRGNEVAVVMFG